MIERACPNCQFFEWSKVDDSKGFCRKNPPIGLMVGEEFKTGWIEVYQHDWCGEFKEDD